MTIVTIKEAQMKLAELIDRAPPGEPVVITRDDQQVAQLVRLPMTLPQPVFGSCKGKLIIVSDDDDHLADFAEYMSSTTTG